MNPFARIHHSPLANFLTISVLVLLLLATLKVNFLLFHTLSELFAIIVAFIMYVVATQTYPFTRNHFLVFLGVAYLWIGCLDLLHTLTFKGVNIFPGLDANPSIQFWIGTRILEVTTLLMAPIFLRRTVNTALVHVVYIILASLFTLSISSGLFPNTYIEGQGLTPFKIYTEYVVIVLLLLAAAHLWLRSQYLDHTILQLAMAAIFFTIMAEVTFTLYVSLDSLSLVIGHILKFISFWLIFTAIIKTTLTEPYSVMARTTTTYDAITTPIVVVDNQGIVHQANRAVFDKTFFAEEDVYFQHCHNLFHNTAIQSRDCVVCQHILQGKPLHGYDIELPEQGIHYEITLNPINLGDEFSGMVHSAQDITARVKTQRSLQESELRFRQLAENIHAMFWMADAETGQLIYVSPAFEQIWGRRVDELKQNHLAIIDTIHPEDREEIRHKLAFMVHDGLDEQYRIIRPDNSLRWIHDRAFPLKDNTGYVYRVIGIAEDITHLIEADDARRASEAKSEFLSRMSHELRTPMNAILGFAQLLELDQSPLSETQQQNINEIITAGKHLLELINEVLDLARIESGKMVLDIVQFDVMEVLHDCLSLIAPISQEKGIQLNMPEMDETYLVLADRMRLKQALVNLLSNAAKYNRENGQIHVTFSKQDARYLQISIRDTGAGISRENMDRLFQPFERLDNTHHVEGTGIGLTLTRYLVELMGGTIRVESEPGVGSTFSFTLPLS